MAVREVYILCSLKHSVLWPLILFCGTFIFAGRMTLAQQVNPVYQVQLKCLKLMSKQWILKNSKCQVHYRLYVVGTLIIAICLCWIKSLTCKDWSKKLQHFLALKCICWWGLSFGSVKVCFVRSKDSMSLLTLGKGTVLWIDQEHLHVLPNYTYFQLSFWFTTIQENIVIKR